MGNPIARFHRHAQSYTPTCKGRFAGRRYDIDWLFGPASWWSSGRARHGLGSDTYARLVPAIEVAAEAMSRYGEVPEYFGVIHADLHFDNILVANNHYSVIDFGDCSLGYYFHDLAIVEQVFRNRVHDQRCITAFHEHYCGERGSRLSCYAISMPL